MEKRTNRFDYDERLIQDPEDFNYLLRLADDRMEQTEISGGWATTTFRPAKIAHAFYLIDDLAEDEEVLGISERKMMNKANGYHTAYLHGLYKADKQESELYDTIAPYHYHNPALQNRLLDGVYVYDANFNYLAQLACGYIPDTFIGDLGYGELAEDEIGFSLLGKQIVELIEEPGVEVSVRFKKKKTPTLQQFVDKISKERDKLRKKTDKTDYIYLKGAMVRMIGILRNNNVWLHAFILGKAKNFMREKSNEDTIYCNVDSIFSLTKREDLPIGQSVGDFKIEYADVRMLYRGYTYAVFDKNNEPLTMKQQGKAKALQDPIAFLNNMASGKTAKYRIIRLGQGGYKILWQ